MILRAFLLSLALVITAGSSYAQDVKAGKKVFRKCSACHFADKEKNKIGPHLVGIIGRPAGTVEGFKYSKAMMKKAEEGLVWTPKTIAEYLKKPSAMIKGTKMSFPGLKKPEDVDNLMAFLESQNAQ